VTGKVEVAGRVEGTGKEEVSGPVVLTYGFLCEPWSWFADVWFWV
jgi:hypothetical protein